MSSSYEDHGTITLVGTLHVSTESTARVAQTIHAEQPDVVAVELDSARLAEHRNPASTRTQAKAALKSGLSPSKIVSGVAFAYLSRKMDSLFDITPGAADMLPAIDHGHKINSKVALVDPVSADINTQVGKALPRDAIRASLLYTKHRFGGANNDWSALVETLEKLDAEQANASADGAIAFFERLTYDELSTLFTAFERVFPRTHQYMLTERNKRIAGHLTWLSHHGYDCVAVLGKAHVPGVATLLSEPLIPSSYLRKPEYDHPPTDE